MSALRRIALAWALLASAAWAKDPGRIVIYPGHGRADAFTLSGRFLEGEAPAPRAHHGKARNLWRNLKALESDEIEGALIEIKVGARAWRARTDDDGVFLLNPMALDPPLSIGVHSVTARAVEDKGHPTGLAHGQLFILPAEGCALISDIDDTILHTGVHSRRQMLKNALLKNADQIRPVEGAAARYRAAGAVGFFYLSGSPQNFMERLTRFLRRHDFPDGAVLLKNFGLDPTLDQARYKGAHLRRILAWHPGLTFTLIGDSSERDPEVYKRLKAEHPGAVGPIYIRRAGGAMSPERRQGITLFDRFDALPHLCPPRAG